MPTSAEVLIVDDDAELGRLLCERLGRYGFAASLVANGAKMLAWLEANSCDLILLDIMLPEEDGLAICRKLRGADSPARNIPIIFTTALGDVSDRIVGLEMGADDYLPKPFDTRELVARIKTVLRRTRTRALEAGTYIYELKPTEVEMPVFGGWKLDIRNRGLIDRTGAVVLLSSTECRLLQLFLEHPGRVLTREDILASLGARAADNYDRSVDVQVNRLRSKLKDTGKHPAIIQTMRGEGYRLVVKVEHL